MEDTVTGQHSFRMQGEELTAPEEWDSLICEVSQVTPQLHRYRYSDSRGLVSYTIYTENAVSMQPV